MVSYPAQYTSEDIDGHLDRLRHYLSRNESFGVVFDLRHTRGLSATERASFGSFLQRHTGSLSRLCVGASIVTVSMVHRGVLTALSWIAPMPFAVHTAIDLDAGAGWIMARLEEHGARSA